MASDTGSGPEKGGPSLLEYAGATGPEHPEEEFFPEIRQARPRVSWDTIVNWLNEVHGIKTVRTTLINRFQKWEKEHSDGSY